MEITRQSVSSGTIRTIDLPITQEQIDAYEAGEYIQVAFANLTADQREFILTGIVQDEWDKLFPAEDDEIEDTSPLNGPEPLPGVVVFEYTNAYDVYSANAMSELTHKGIITRQEMKARGSHLHCTDIYPVIEVMKDFGFKYYIKGGK